MQNLPKVNFIHPAVSSASSGLLSCPYCEMSFTSPVDLNLHSTLPKHLDSRSAPFPGIFQCEKCLKTFETHQGLRQHEGKVHSSLKKAKCKYCNKRFKNTYAVKYHRLQVHDKRNRVECYLCGKVLYNHFNFKNHLKKCQERFFGEKALITVGGEHLN